MVVPQDIDVESEDVCPRPAKKPRTRVWKEEDIQNEPLPQFSPTAPEYLRQPYEYFSQFFTQDLVDHIVFHTNLYARQEDVSTSFSINVQDLMVFLGLVIYMGVVPLPSIIDYWNTWTRISQVADYMSRNRFKAIRSTLHFNDNDQATGSKDRFFKIWPLFTKVTRELLKVEETPVHSIDEVMVKYKGTRAGNLRQYMAKKPDKWGFKLFCRSSVDGFIHDILMYQGESTFECHHMQLAAEEKDLCVTSKTVLVLVRTVKNPRLSAVYADNYFTSIGLAEYLREQYGCRYVGTARENRVGHPPIESVKAMDKKAVPKGKLHYVSSEGVLVARWKDNSIVTILSTDVGIEPMKSVLRYDRTAKKKVEVPCPEVVDRYNSRMGGIDKSDMLTHLYKTPYKARRYYMRLFAYILDLVICNSWILYKRDCVALKEKKVMPLKDFRLSVSFWLRSFKSFVPKVSRTSLGRPVVPVPKKGQRAVIPSVQSRQDATSLHMPLYVKNRQTCKYCSTKDQVHRSRWVCETCKVALCLSESRHCFSNFHKVGK